MSVLPSRATPDDPECVRCGMLRSEHDPFIGNTSGERSGCTFPKYGDKAEAPATTGSIKKGV